MKNKFIIGMLTMVSILSLSYGFYQKDRADRNELRAIESERIAKEMRNQAAESMVLADLQRKRAEENEQYAVMHRMRAEELSQKKVK
jgi:Tfp pilus assembly protein PilO